MNASSSKSINIDMMESWFVLSRKYLRIGLRVLSYDVQFYLGPGANLVNIGASHVRKLLASDSCVNYHLRKMLVFPISTDSTFTAGDADLSLLFPQGFPPITRALPEGARHPPRLGREGKLELTEDHGWNNRA